MGYFKSDMLKYEKDHAAANILDLIPHITSRTRIYFQQTNQKMKYLERW